MPETVDSSRNPSVAIKSDSKEQLGVQPLTWHARPRPRALCWDFPVPPGRCPSPTPSPSHPRRSCPPPWGGCRSGLVCGGASSCACQTRRGLIPLRSPRSRQAAPKGLGRCTGGPGPRTEASQDKCLKLMAKTNCDIIQHPKYVEFTSMFSFSSTKKASPLSPSFMCRSTGSPLTSMST